MRTPRHSHTATLLGDGKVLLTGGYSAIGEYLRGAELYEPVSGTFGPTGEMNSARAAHLAVSLQDGRVLLLGGVGTGWTFLSSAEIYDPAAGAFLPAGEMTIRRHKHDAVLLPDGRVLITGGADEDDSRGVYASAELYDPGTGLFRKTGAMRMPRYKHQGTSAVLPDGRVLLAGGTTRAEVYDPQTGTYSLVGGEARLAGQFSASALLSDGQVLISGGYGDSLGPQDGAWAYRP